jgi:YfiH family protein
VVAAAHAGWRGLLAGVLEHTVEAMAVEPRRLLAWLGPAIGPAAFEVGPEVRERFLAAAANTDIVATAACFLPSADRPGHYLADLCSLARLRLAASGLSRIGGGHWCTFNEPALFFSYRRDGLTGRMATVIAPNPAQSPT